MSIKNLTKWIVSAVILALLYIAMNNLSATWIDLKTISVTNSTNETLATSKTKNTSSSLSWNKIGNTFEKAKTKLEKSIYNDKVLPRVEVYCGCKYNSVKKTLDCPFKKTTKSDRWLKIEWEHVVPAENFGKAFKEWREWDKKLCWTKKGRECAKKNADFARMEWDMYNLYPANGELNGLRSNRKYGELSEYSKTVKTFQGCTSMIDYELDQFEPPENMKWELARVHLYFDYVYSQYNLSEQQKNLFITWSKQHPVTANECKRYLAIKGIQWTDNPILAKLCK